jgi:succinoglycan biosynthesis transport protein ExoP
VVWGEYTGEAWFAAHVGPTNGERLVREPARDDSPFREWLSLLSRQRWVVVVTVTVATLAAFAVSRSEQRLYQASASVLVNEQNPTVAALNLASTPSSPPDRYAATQAALARVGDVAQMTIDAAHVPGLTAAELLAASSVSADPTADLLQFSVTDPDPAVARTLATAYAREFTAYRRKLDTSAITAGLADVQRRLARLEALGQGNSPLAHQLTGTTHQLEGLQALAASGSSAIPVGQAGNASVVQPRTKRNVALGLLAGLALGVVLAFLRDALDHRVRSDDELRERLGLPVLGHIPRRRGATSSDGSLMALTEPAGPSAEAYRILKTNLSISQRQHNVASIVVTSTGEGDGKSTTAANLAVTLARAQVRVALVDLDLRDPGIDALFGLDRRPGLTSVATGESTLADALHEIDFRPDAPADGGRLEVLTVGSVPPDPGELLSSAFVANLLFALKRRSDVLLIDSPPMLAVGDAMTIATQTDAVLLVVDVNTARRETLAEARRVLEACPARALGLVATGCNGAGTHEYRHNGYRRTKAPDA